MNLAHYALQKLFILPSVLDAMGRREKAFVYASIQIKIEQDRREAAKIKT